ncbi:hypothetical protein GE21DRAFT_1098750 [Neurospora crassa]|nr:hypothetical protein GE21DRAFT_1098750 [Neurospora crassa]
MTTQKLLVQLRAATIIPPQALHSEQVQPSHDIRLALPHTAKPGQERYYSADGMAGSLADWQN